MNNKMLKNILVLTIITVVAGFLLGFAYDITKAPIAAQQEKTKQEAYESVFSEAVSFSGEDAALKQDMDNAAGWLETAGYTQESIDEALAAKDASGNTIGFVFTITTSEGYGGDIEISMGIQNDGTVTGVEILSISETAGLGMKSTEPEFKNQFANKKVEKFSYTKTGATADYEIDALSGATITTNAMVNAVDAGLAFYQASSACQAGSEGGTANE